MSLPNTNNTPQQYTLRDNLNHLNHQTTVVSHKLTAKQNPHYECDQRKKREHK